jgi:N-acetylneuraminic acid mutarotase
MKNLIYLCISYTFFAGQILAQSVTIDPSNAPSNTSIIKVNDASKGILPPKMTSSQRLAIAQPEQGLLVYQTDLPSGFYVNDGSPVSPIWKLLSYTSGTVNPVHTGSNVLSEIKNNSNLLNAGFSMKGFTTLSINPYLLNNYTWYKTLSLSNTFAGNSAHSAVWTGDKMIVWGGVGLSSGGAASGLLNTGKSYNFATNIWQNLSPVLLPPRQSHICVWTGSKMIIWGGLNFSAQTFNDGAIYDPLNDTWTFSSLSNAPSPRSGCPSVWSGSQMIVWGGGSFVSTVFTLISDGKMYNPTTNSWTSMTPINSPSARYSHTAVWTGSKMIVWGGLTSIGATNTGGIYDPATDAWTATSTVGAPPFGVYGHSAIWTGTKMIVFGGNTGAGVTDQSYIYDLATNSWSSVSNINRPQGRQAHTAVWTGEKMIVFGGSGPSSLSNGGVYDLATNTWDANPNVITSAIPYSSHTALWVGDEMIVYGNANGVVLKKDFQSAVFKNMYLYEKN